MGKKIRISASILNIRLHPHSEIHYLEWIKFLFALKLGIRLRGDKYGVISTIDESQVTSGIISGIITTYTRIEIDGTWFNIEELKTATREQISEISIPENLAPNSASFYFLFDCIKHKLYFQTYSQGKTLSQNFALKLFDGLAKNILTEKQFNYAKINVVQDEASLDRLFGLSKIKKISISIEKPNNDILNDGFEGIIEDYMSGMHARELNVDFVAESGQSLEPNADVNRLSKVALENGEVLVNGRENGVSVSLKSSEFPKVLANTFDPEQTSESEAFQTMVRKQ